MRVELDLNMVRMSISDWLEELGVGLSPGRFRFCLKGGLVPTDGHQGQVSTCFAMKIAWQTGLWGQWTQRQRQACVEFVRSFQREDGFFFDHWLSAHTKVSIKEWLCVLSGRVRWIDLWVRNKRNLRAETRQSAATLLMVGAKPKYPMPCEVTDVDSVKRYVESLDWCNPWSAGSHVSHQLFMLTVNHQCFGKPDNYEELINAFLGQLTQFYDKRTGTWFGSDPSDTIKINGAMKVFSGLQWLKHPYPNTRVLLDFALRQPFQKDSCGFLNRLFVVQQAVKGVPSGYRQEAIHRLAFEVLGAVNHFRQTDRAFSFFEEHAQTRYYNAPVSQGYLVSDLHGTTMLVWAIAITLELLGDEAPIEAKCWRAHKA